jgi:hypothetical protein
LGRTVALRQRGVVAAGVGVDHRNVARLVADKRERELRRGAIAERNGFVDGAVDRRHGSGHDGEQRSKDHAREDELAHQ